LVGFATWTEPPDRPITPADREAILDGLWAVAPLTGGARAVVEYVHDAATYVARRWDRGEDGHLVRVHTTTVEILELQRTARVPFSPKAGTPPGRSVAVVRPSGSILTAAPPPPRSGTASQQSSAAPNRTTS
jgi:hypothetical protein